MRFEEYLAAEWRPALGCTEPASIAYAAATAGQLAGAGVSAVHLVCDPRIYKNCYAVGIPHSGHKIGLRWALAIGCLLPDPSRGLECFKQITPAILEEAGRLIDAGAVTVEIDRSCRELLVDCRVTSAAGNGRAVIEREHTRLVRLEASGQRVALAVEPTAISTSLVREQLSTLEPGELIALATELTTADRESLRRGMASNLAISWHGLALFPKQFVNLVGNDPLTRISRLVCSGVYARMSGEDFAVMSLAGSGNKGITCAVPLAVWGEEQGLPSARIEEALALACLLTSSTTHHLGTLSAVCGCSNAAGIGLSAGLVYLMGGAEDAVSLAINNMVGNLTGMICDGAKIGCALKTMTAVDAAFRSASLAIQGIGIPVSDGIVGAGGMASLRNLARIATFGMTATDEEILKIMQEKLRITDAPGDCSLRQCPPPPKESSR